MAWAVWARAVWALIVRRQARQKRLLLGQWVLDVQRVDAVPVYVIECNFMLIIIIRINELVLRL